MKINIQEKKEDILSTIKLFGDSINLENAGEKLENYFKGFDGYKATVEQIYKFIFNLLIENDLVYAVDWKWSLEDELFQFKNKIEGFDFEIIEIEEDEDFEVTAKIEIGDVEYNLESCSLYDFFYEINKILGDIGSPKRAIIIDGGTGDTLYYSIVDQQSYYDLLESEYLPYKSN